MILLNDILIYLNKCCNIVKFLFNFFSIKKSVGNSLTPPKKEYNRKTLLGFFSLSIEEFAATALSVISVEYFSLGIIGKKFFQQYNAIEIY